MLTLKFLDSKVSMQRPIDSNNTFLDNIFTSYRSASKSETRWHFVVNHGGQSIRTRSVQLSPLKELHFTAQPRINLQLHFDESIELWDSDTSDTVEFVLMERQAKEEAPIKRALGTVSMRKFRDTPERRVEYTLALEALVDDQDNEDSISVSADLRLLTTYSHDVYNQSLMGNMFACMIPCITCPPTMPSTENDRPYTQSGSGGSAKLAPAEQHQLTNGIESSQPNQVLVGGSL